MDGESWDVASSATQTRHRSPMATTEKLLRRVDPVGHIGACVAGRSRAEAVPGSDDRRCDQSAVCPVRGARYRRREHARVEGISGTLWTSAGGLHRQSRDVRSEGEACRGWRWGADAADPDYSCVDGAGDRTDLGT